MLDEARFAAGMAARQRDLGDDDVARCMANAGAVSAFRIAQDVIADHDHATQS